MRRKSLFQKVVKGFGIFCVVALFVTLGLAAWYQNDRLQKTDAKLKKQTNELAELTTEKESLEKTLTNKEAYIAEFDTTLFAAKEEEDFLEQNPPSEEELEEETEEEEEPSSSSASYKKKYKNLYASKKKEGSSGEKVVYLTFDDGPSHNTPKVLDILDEYDIKATFFVVKVDEEPYTDYYKEIVDRGHTIAIHTASHKYQKIYKSVDAYLEDFNEVYSLVVEKTGVKPNLFRYPGGSTNCQGYAAGDDIMKEMERRGFTYYDWNVSSGDGGNQATRDTIYDWVTGNAGNRSYSVVLMHDSGGKAETVAALPSIIENLQSRGCTFKALDDNSTPVQFGK